MVADSEERRKAIYVANEALAVSRSNAINKFAEIEQHLAMLFNALQQQGTGTDSFTAFARLKGNGVRLQTIQALVDKQCPQYSTYFSRLSKRISRLEATRNKIVHWIQMTSRHNGSFSVALFEHPDLSKHGRLTKDAVDHFIDKAAFYSMLAFYLSVHVRHPQTVNYPSPGDMRPWLTIYAEALVFPPVADHPFHPDRMKPLPFVGAT